MRKALAFSALEMVVLYRIISKEIYPIFPLCLERNFEKIVLASLLLVTLTSWENIEFNLSVVKP